MLVKKEKPGFLEVTSQNKGVKNHSLFTGLFFL